MSGTEGEREVGSMVPSLSYRSFYDEEYASLDANGPFTTLDYRWGPPSREGTPSMTISPCSAITTQTNSTVNSETPGHVDGYIPLANLYSPCNENHFAVYENPSQTNKDYMPSFDAFLYSLDFGAPGDYYRPLRTAHTVQNAELPRHKFGNMSYEDPIEKVTPGPSPPCVDKSEGPSALHHKRTTTGEDLSRSGLSKGSDLSANATGTDNVVLVAGLSSCAPVMQSVREANPAHQSDRERTKKMCGADTKSNVIICGETFHSGEDREYEHNSNDSLQHADLSSQSGYGDNSPSGVAESQRFSDFTGSDNDENEGGTRERQVNKEIQSSPCESCTSGNHSPDISDLDVEWILQNALRKTKEKLLEELVGFAEATPTEGSDYSESRKRNREPSPPPSSSASLDSCRRRPQKRLRGTGKDLGDDGDSDDDKGQMTRPQKPSVLNLRRLRCPFNQREPDKFIRPACKGGGFTDIAKLKDHIKRVHLQPLRCQRCWEEMESDEAYAVHLQAEMICNKQSEPIDQRLPRSILKRLDFKKPPYAKAKDADEKWRIMYSVLFPDDTNIPSPYSQNSFTSKQQQLLHDALEEELIKKMTPAFEPILEEIKRSIPSIIDNYRVRLLQDASETPSSITTSSVGDSERESRNQQLASPPNSDTSASKETLQVAKSGPTQQCCVFPADTSFGGTQEPREASSPGTIPGSGSSGTGVGRADAEYRIQSFSRIAHTSDYQSPYPPLPDNLQRTFSQVGKSPSGLENAQGLQSTLQSQMPPSIAQGSHAWQKYLDAHHSAVETSLHMPNNQELFTPQGNSFPPLNVDDFLMVQDDFSANTAFGAYPDISDFNPLHDGSDVELIGNRFYDP